jgi:hypothetical protein
MTGRVVTTDAEIRAAIALANTREQDDLRAVRARYDPAQDRILITLATEIEIAVPRRLLQGLQDATPEQLAAIEIQELGQGLHWPALDVDHYVPGILEGIFGTRRWMSAIGRKGGSVRSPAKARAARINGRKGGRRAVGLMRSSFDFTQRPVAAHKRKRAFRRRTRKRR